MPAVNPKKLKRLLVAELLTPFAMKRRLSSGQLEDLVYRAMQDKRFDLSASSDDFAHYMNVEQATDWATELQQGGTAPHIFSNADQANARTEEMYGGMKKSDFEKLPAETRLRIINKVEAELAKKRH
jgi:hypothetical protein